MMEEFRIQNREYRIGSGWNIVESSVGYRFWPDKVKGEGFFIACIKKLDGETESELRVRTKLELLTKKEMEIAKRWISVTDHEFVKIIRRVYAVPKKILNEINVLSNRLNIIYFGTLIGELIRDKLIPDHALAMSPLVAERIERVELAYDESISYLKKKELSISVGRGWKLVSYKNYPLGWINVLANRINNYYPKELRILKDI